MVDAREVLSPETQTAVINRVKSPNQFIRRLLFQRHESVPTEKIELSTVSKGREMAPFVRKNGAAILVGGDTETFYTLSPPNIKILRELKPDEVLFRRRPGDDIFQIAGEVSSSGERYIQRQLAEMADMITNSEEWLCAQTLTGTVTYSDERGDVFQITFPRPSGHTIDLTAGNYWDDANVNPFDDVNQAKFLISEEEGVQPTDVLLSPEAANALRNNTAFKAQINTQSGIVVGGLDYTQFYNDDGAIFVGRAYGLNWWEYPRTIVMPDGTTSKLIRPFYAEFVSATAGAENLIYYGAIADFDAGPSGLFVGERFSKSWIEKNPSVMDMMAQSKPLPCMRRWGSMVSMKVTD